jgi:hypothetical protein
VLGHVNGALAVRERVAGDDVGTVGNLAEVTHEDCAAARARARADGHGGEVLNVLHHRVDGDEGIFVAQREIAGGTERIRCGYRGDNFISGNAVAAEAVGLEVDENCPRATAERRRRGNSGQRRKKRAHLVERGVLHFADGAVGVRRGENEVAHGHRAGIEARDERPRRAWRHERAGAVHVGHHLGQRGRHVHVRVELKLHDARALNGLRLDVLDARDVEEVIFVEVGDVALHLRRIHAAEGLRNVNGRDAQRWEHVARHALKGNPRAQRDGDDADHDGERAAEREADQIHVGGKTARRAAELQDGKCDTDEGESLQPGSLSFSRAKRPFPGSETPFPRRRTPFPTAGKPFPRAKTPFPCSRKPFPGAERPFPRTKMPFPCSKTPFPCSKTPFPGAGKPFPSSRKALATSPKAFPKVKTVRKALLPPIRNETRWDG